MSLYRWQRAQIPGVDLTTRRHRVRHPVADRLRLPIQEPYVSWDGVGIKERVLVLMLTILLLVANILPAVLDAAEVVYPHELNRRPYQSRLATATADCLWRPYYE
jgi:hypothetical protein